MWNCCVYAVIIPEIWNISIWNIAQKRGPGFPRPSLCCAVRRVATPGDAFAVPSLFDSWCGIALPLPVSAVHSLLCLCFALLGFSFPCPCRAIRRFGVPRLAYTVPISAFPCHSGAMRSVSRPCLSLAESGLATPLRCCAIRTVQCHCLSTLCLCCAAPFWAVLSRAVAGLRRAEPCRCEERRIEA